MNNAPFMQHRMHRGRSFLENNYVVWFGSNPVGRVQVFCQGLYYRILCRCELSGDVMCRLEVSSGENRQNLGIVVPMGSGFGLDTKLPIKRVGQGTLAFQLIAQNENEKRQFIPISPEEPFAYLSRVKSAYLVKRNGAAGIAVEG